MACDLCENRGWIHGSIKDGNVEIQRCDTCARFETDDDAAKHVIGLAMTLERASKIAAHANSLNALPDLLKTCEAVMAWWEEHQYDVSNNGDDERNLYDSDPEMVDLARAAIAKARGE